MTIARSTIVRGPAIVTFKSQVFYSTEDIVATPNLAAVKINVAAFGDVDEIVTDITWDVTFTPVQWSAGALTVLFPYTNPTIGGSIYGSDSNVVVQSSRARR